MLKTKDSSTEKIVETLNLYFHYVIRIFSVVDGTEPTHIGFVCYKIGNFSPPQDLTDLNKNELVFLAILF